MKHFFLFISLLIFSCSTQVESPTVIKNFSELATAEEVVEFAKVASQHTDKLDLEIFGSTSEDRDLVLIRSKLKQSNNPLRVLVFAQQHGNEPSGKEASLLLIRDLASNQHSDWLRDMEIVIIPQLNPDGGNLDKRRNGQEIDLNRDHVVLQASETRAIHKVFKDFMPHVTIDIHEYYPYSKSWDEFGAFKNFDVQVGVPTNINVSQEIRNFGLLKALPYIETSLLKNEYTFHHYIVGPAPNLGRTRHSTVDIDDGRQSFAILGTLSFIFEGINGRTGVLDSIEHRTYGQYEALKALLHFVHQNASEIKTIVDDARNKLRSSKPGEVVAIRLEHFPSGNPLTLPLVSSTTGNDTVVIVENYHPIVKSTLNATKPKAYLIPTNDALLVNFLNLHGVKYENFEVQDAKVITRYFVESIAISEDEELENRLPTVIKQKIINEELNDLYLWVPTGQLHSNFLVTLFEPQSMLGLAQRIGYEYLLQERDFFSILRVEE